MKQLVKNIGMLAGIDNHGLLRLQGAEMAQFHTMANAFLSTENGCFSDFGDMADCPEEDGFDSIVDAAGGTVMPSWCDSHTHIVYAGSRESEFIDKIRGLSYAEIAKRGGGILNSADRLHELTEDELYQQAFPRLEEVILKGTGAIEIKSGYGLTLDDEMKMLRVIRRLSQATNARVIATFLGAHAVGRAFAGRQDDYVSHIINDMLPVVAAEGLAQYIDVFCDEGFFTPEQTMRILHEGEKYGLRGKIHGDELADSGGTRVAVQCNALSVDHLEAMSNESIELLRDSETMPTVLPGTSFFLNMPLAPARRMIDAGLGVAAASDYNPGSTPSGDMKFIVSLACIKHRLLPAEALNAVTINSAYAMGLSREYGSIRKGKVANFFITRKIPSIDFVPYTYTTPIIKEVYLKGEKYVPRLMR